MARRDDGNEPIPTIPLHPLTGQVDLVEPLPCNPVGDGSPLPGLDPLPNPAPPGRGNPYDWSSYPEICRFGIRPQQLNGLFMRFLQGHFARSENIYTPELRESALWGPGQDSKLWITSNTSTDLSKVGQVPRLVLKRGRQESMRIGMGDSANWNTRLLDRGTSTYCRMNRGVTTIYATGETDGQTELLGQEVFQAISWATPIITKHLPFHDLQVASMGEMAILSAEGDQFTVPIELSYIYEYAWRNTEMSPALSALQFVIEART